MNFARNGIGENDNHTEVADGLAWLSACRKSYDLIFIDPPTFSNTKKEKRVFDIQEDHIRLLTLAMGCLAPNGLLVFSTNFRKFHLDSQLCERYMVSDITATTIPFDFHRDTKVHRCWEFRHSPD